VPKKYVNYLALCLLIIPSAIFYFTHEHSNKPDMNKLTLSDKKTVFYTSQEIKIIHPYIKRATNCITVYKKQHPLEEIIKIFIEAERESPISINLIKSKNGTLITDSLMLVFHEDNLSDKCEMLNEK
jgi:hypothetical protein